MKNRDYTRADYVFTVQRERERLNTNGATPVGMEVRRFCSAKYTPQSIGAIRGVVVLDSDPLEVGEPVAVRLYFPRERISHGE